MSALHPADWLIIAVLACSLVIGFSRGLVREVVALTGWIAAIVVARLFNEPLSAYLAQWVGTPSVRLILSYGLLFAGTLFGASLLAHALSLMAHASGLSLIDRMFGGVFGVVRGLLFVLIALMLMAPFVKHDGWFHDARLPRVILTYEPLVRRLQQDVLQLVAPRSPAPASGAEKSSP